VGEKSKGQITDQRGIEDAIRQSLRAERPRARTIAAARTQSRWFGADKTIVKQRGSGSPTARFRDEVEGEREIKKAKKVTKVRVRSSTKRKKTKR